MKKIVSTLVMGFALSAVANAATQEKEWTHLIFLNGNNNLDSFGAMNINEMEKVGSSDKINVVVQWASMAEKDTKRVFVHKDNDTKNVTSPVVQNVGNVDMGSPASLLDFISWGVKNYPAKHYFIEVWNHGGGWHLKGNTHINDISWDDKSGNVITTEQLGQVMSDAAKVIGHKVDVYGSDACLMAMLEVAGEMSSSVEVFAGSQETEPGSGWPYDKVLQRWNALPHASAQDVGKILTEEYVKSYQGGSHGNQDVTFSALDLSKTEALNAAIHDFANELSKLNKADATKVKNLVPLVQTFAVTDYLDFMDFTASVQKAGVGLRSDLVASVNKAANDYILANKVTSGYPNAKGFSVWIPADIDGYNQYSSRFAGLEFNKQTGWSAALENILR